MSTDNVIKVLTIPYTQVEFLINREQCSTSVFIAETKDRKTLSPYLQQGLKYGEQLVPLFGLDEFFQDVFRVEPAGEAHLALIREKNSFSETIQDKISIWEDAFYAEGDSRGDKIAFRIASGTIMMEVPLKDLHLQPPVLSSPMEKQGLMAVSFSHDGKIRYLVDLDLLLDQKILREGRQEHENSDC